MHFALLFPPSVDPRAPHLAIPALAALLRRYNVRVTVRDLNLEGLLWITGRERLAEAERAARARLAAAATEDGERQRLRRVLARAPFVVEGAERAVATLRDGEAFYDPDRYNEARNTLRYALSLVSAASGRVRYGYSNAVYEVEGCNPSVLADLARVTAEPLANLFLPLWEESLFGQLEADRPDIVGISILNGQQIVPGLTLARALRERGHRVLIGGTVYSKFVPQLMRRPEFFRLFCDGLVPYEGEPALRGLIEAGGWGRDLSAVPNLMRLDSQGRPALGPARVEDVDALPVPDFSGLPLGLYLAPEPVLPILTGKGCYFNRCKFCDIPQINSISTKAYRVRRPETVAADVAALNREYGARHFVITDETLSPGLLLGLADAMEGRDDLRGVGPRFVGYARFEKGFTPQVCRRLSAAGVRKLFFGLESGSQATLDHMDKGVSIGVARNVLRDCVESGIAVHVFSMIGFPQESEASARETLSFFLENSALFRHPRHSFDIHRFGLDLRTDYFDNAAAYGALVNFDALNALDFPISVREWSNSEGLGEADVGRLISEFETVLNREFRATHLYPDQHWPGFEEYAVLYGDRYDSAPFAYRTALPPAGDPQRFRLEWTPSARFGSPGAGAQAAWGVAGEVVLGETAFAALEPLPGEMTVDELLNTLGRRIEHATEQEEDLLDELRQVVDALIGERLLWFRPANGTRLQATGGERPRQMSLRLRRDVSLSIVYDDRTPYGSPVGSRPSENARRAFAPLLEHVKARGLQSAILEGPELLRSVRTSAAFREMTNGAAGALREGLLHPDPDEAAPAALQFSCPSSGEDLSIEVPAGGWPVYADLLAHLSGADLTAATLSEEARRFAGELSRRGLVEPRGPGVDARALRSCEVIFVGHNTVVLRAADTSIVIDPFLVAADGSSRYAPLGRAEIGAVNAVLVTHSHPDHFDPASLLRFDRDTRVVVPRVERESLLAIDMARRCRELGLTNVVELGWGESLRVGEFEVEALPFYGEQPTSGGVLHPEVRNQGNTYLVRSREFSAALVADAGRDHAGDIRQVAKDCRAAHGPVDILFAGYRGWSTYPVQLALSSVPQYLFFVPPEEWGVRQQLMSDAEGVIDLAEAWGAPLVVPYGAGGAPWYWELGLGPRLDGSGVEDPSFDPFPERVREAASKRLWGGGGWISSPAEVCVLRPGDGLRDVRGARELLRVPGYAWPW